jgi:hypothetical protein
MLLVSLERLRWIGVHQLGLRLFGTMVHKLLIIESFFHWKLNEIKTKHCIQIWLHSWCSWKTLGEPNLIEFISQFSELRCGKYWFLMHFDVENSNKLQKLCLEGKISWTFNVFTLGPTTQTTLVMMNWWKIWDNFVKMKSYLNELVLNKFPQCNLNWMQLNWIWFQFKFLNWVQNTLNWIKFCWVEFNQMINIQLWEDMC